MEISKILGNKVAVITDNDKNYIDNITNNYSDYTQDQYPNIQIFSDNDNTRYTFEVCLYNDNQVICDAEFQTPHRRLNTLDYMLNNKAEVAYVLMKNRAETITVPQYIQKACIWIDA